ncbi:hypothetical protein C1I98_32090 [Spongiactinospora gelatinilytica]|uniref:Phage shock protein PspC N-terminal domain-containing protein n=1 Tax=Spongiactinospora gelatinilytica TaxID=2666298 RepID=A0A2W2G5E7_9ACTN|nr:PspC domain-containing protein [Spongiactinospora gelatinilytica]PZG29417.1 hypothetical protein C1I98_32090 [Spongiactinospora gelatinilytica]
MNDYTGVKKLQRTRDGRIVAGVASGIGRYVGVDPNIIRIGLGIATFFGGLGVAIYAAGWLLLPDEGKDTSIVQDLVEKQKAGTAPWQQHGPRSGHPGPHGRDANGWQQATGDGSPYQYPGAPSGQGTYTPPSDPLKDAPVDRPETPPQSGEQRPQG